MYRNETRINYFSERYGKYITVPVGYWSNGADVVADFYPPSWFIHDWGCGSYFGRGPKPVGGQWDDGSPMTNWQLSHVFTDVIRDEAAAKIKTSNRITSKVKHCIGWLVLPITRFWGTWLFGGGKARDNGMW